MNKAVKKVSQEIADRLMGNVGKVIVGKKETIELVLVALLCEGHVLIEDVPGTGKTMLAKAVAKSLSCSFKRIQSTPDLLPSDVLLPPRTPLSWRALSLCPRHSLTAFSSESVSATPPKMRREQFCPVFNTKAPWTTWRA